jgi:hypothetical protein
MPLYFSAHTTACLTKQSLREVMLELFAAREVKVRRAVASQIAGRMLIEVEAADAASLERFLKARNLVWEWIMRIDLDGSGGTVSET